MIPIPRLFPILLPVLLAACAVRVEAPPEHALPDRFDQMPAEAAPQALDAWWRAWNDPILTDLIDRGLANNNDLKQAQASLREARAMAAVVDSALYPDLAANAGASAASWNSGNPAPCRATRPWSPTTWPGWRRSGRSTCSAGAAAMRPPPARPRPANRSGSMARAC